MSEMACSAEIKQFSHAHVTKRGNITVSPQSPQFQIRRKHITYPFKQKTSFSLPTKRLPKEFPNPRNLAEKAPTNSQLIKFCHDGDLEIALNHLKLMHDLKVEVEESAFVSLIRLCEAKKGHVEGVYAWGIMLEMGGCSLSVGVGNAFLNMFVRFGDLGNAWNVFGRMTERNLFSWNVLIGAYAKLGYPEEALCLYHRMLWIGIVPDVYTFPCVLRSCAAAQDIKRGKEVHCHVLRYGLEQDISAVNSLITMYAKCGNVLLSFKVFDKMLVRDRISWNAMISGFIENDEYLKGLELFVKMRELQIDFDVMTMTSVISACELLLNWKLARQIHGLLVTTGYSSDVSVCNSLIKLFLRLENWKDGERVFSRMPCKDIITWTTMISSYDVSLMHGKALEVYKTMKLEGIKPDEVTIASLLSSCASLGELHMGMKLHDLADRLGFTSYELVANALIDMYSKCKSIDKALEVFHSVRHKNVVSWTSIIVGLRINNRCYDALKFFWQMKRKMEPNTVTLISVLAACGRMGALMCGKEIHAHVLKLGIAHDGFLPNAILDFYVKCGRMTIAQNQFKYLGKNVAAWNIMLTGYAQRSQGEKAIKLFQTMTNSKVQPDDVTLISLLCACSRSLKVSEGLEHFNTMKQRYGIEPNLKHYACVVDLLGRAGMLEDAHELIQKMPLTPDAAVWGALLNACRMHQQVELGEVAAQHIFTEQIESVGYYVLLCNFYSSCNKWSEVTKVRRIMKERGLVADPGCSWVEVKGKVFAFLCDDHYHPQFNSLQTVLEQFYDQMDDVCLNELETCCAHKDEAGKANIFCGHSERLAVAFSLVNTAPGTPIWVTKNLYMCQYCHNIIKFISKAVRREITVRDTEQFHHFKDGVCSCGDDIRLVS